MTLEERVIKVVQNQFDTSAIDRESYLTALGADPLDIIELSMEIEDEFTITLPDEVEWKTVADIIESVRAVI